MQMLEMRKELEDEHYAWLDVFLQIALTFKISHAELNEEKYRDIFKMIERWAYYDRVRRQKLIELEGEDKYPYGIFWEGE